MMLSFTFVLYLYDYDWDQQVNQEFWKLIVLSCITNFTGNCQSLQLLAGKDKTQQLKL